MENAKEKSADVNIYHAHGYVIHSENQTTGDEIWDRNSAFSQVFFDFERAKKHLLEQFEKLLADIYRRDKLFEGETEEERDIKKQSPAWRREYIDEYIDYCLVISELTLEYSADNIKIDFTNPPQIDWYFRYNGEMSTRYFVFGDKEYECRESDLLGEAGTKFNVGDLVEYTDCEYWRDYPGMLIVLNTPQKPRDKTTPWENLYRLVYIDDYYALRHSGRIAHTDIHEADLKLCDKERMERDLNKEPVLALQRVVKGEADISPELREDILCGRVLFNTMPSWRDFPELTKKD